MKAERIGMACPRRHKAPVRKTGKRGGVCIIYRRRFETLDDDYLIHNPFINHHMHEQLNDLSERLTEHKLTPTEKLAYMWLRCLAKHKYGGRWRPEDMTIELAAEEFQWFCDIPFSTSLRAMRALIEKGAMPDVFEKVSA